MHFLYGWCSLPQTESTFPKFLLPPPMFLVALPKSEEWGDMAWPIRGQRQRRVHNTQYIFKDKDKALSKSFYCPRPEIFLMALSKSIKLLGERVARWLIRWLLTDDRETKDSSSKKKENDIQHQDTSKPAVVCMSFCQLSKRSSFFVQTMKLITFQSKRKEQDGWWWRGLVLAAELCDGRMKWKWRTWTSLSWKQRLRYFHCVHIAKVMNFFSV